MLVGCSEACPACVSLQVVGLCWNKGAQRNHRDYFFLLHCTTSQPLKNRPFSPNIAARAEQKIAIQHSPQAMKSQRASKDLVVGVTSHKSRVIIQLSFNPLSIHLPKCIGHNVHSMRIGFQVDLCERDKPDWMRIWCVSRCTHEWAVK